GGLPAGVVRDLRVGEEIGRGGVEEDRVAAHAMAHERVLQLAPDRIVPALVFGLLAGVDGHAKGLAEHGHPRGWARLPGKRAPARPRRHTPGATPVLRLKSRLK